MRWYSLSLQVPITYQNMISDLELLYRLTDIVNGVARDVCQLVQIEDSRPDFQAQINALQEKTSDMQSVLYDVQTDLADQADRLAKLDTKLKLLTIDVDNKNAAISKEMIDMQNRWRYLLGQTAQGLQNEIDATNKLITDSNDLIKADIKDYVDTLYKASKIYYVVNPITKQIGEINDVLAMMWDFTNRLPTAGEVAALGMTAGEFKSLRLTVLEYTKSFYKTVQRAGLKFTPIDIDISKITVDGDSFHTRVNISADSSIFDFDNTTMCVIYLQNANGDYKLPAMIQKDNGAVTLQSISTYPIQISSNTIAKIYIA